MKYKSLPVWLTITLTCLCISLQAQPPGQWDTTSIGRAKTTTSNAVGIGTSLPNGMQEIDYCNDQLNGLVITKGDCGIFTLGPNDFLTPSFDFKLDSAGFGESVVLPTTFTIPLNFFLTGYNTSAAKPMIWARTKNTLASTPTASGTHTTRFIVTPYGRSGLNIENPRATLDIKSLGTYNIPAVIIGRQKPGTVDRTQHLHFVPLLGNKGYNRISQKDDQGIFYTDGQNDSGANLNGAFVIAPWTHRDSLSHLGIRMDAKGNVGIGVVNTGGYKLAVNGSVLIKNEIKISPTLITWPDYVFRDYSNGIKPQSLYEIEKFVLKNYHLPDMPSEEQIKADGINTSEMLALLLKKIEELTLQNIEQQKEIDALKKK